MVRFLNAENLWILAFLFTKFTGNRASRVFPKSYFVAIFSRLKGIKQFWLFLLDFIKAIPVAIFNCCICFTCLCAFDCVRVYCLVYSSLSLSHYRIWKMTFVEYVINVPPPKASNWNVQIVRKPTTKNVVLWILGVSDTSLLGILNGSVVHAMRIFFLLQV